MSRIGSLSEKGEVHWRKRWGKGVACCYVAIQTSNGRLLQTETYLTEEQLRALLKAIGLGPKEVKR